MNIHPVLDRLCLNTGLGSSRACYDVMYFTARLHGCRRILEVGTYRGASAIAFCQAVLDNGGTPDLWTVDDWSQADERAIAVANFKEAGVDGFITMKDGDSGVVVPALPGSWDLAFIDGCHSFEAATRDYVNVRSKAGMVLFHDTGDGDPERVPYLSQARADGLSLFHFATRYVEGDGHLVGITLAKKGN